MSEKPTQRSNTSDGSAGAGNRQRRLRPSGGYRALRSFKASTVIYDGTVSFCDRFVDRRSRTHDQMVQAARSGRQNIAEGSGAAATSDRGAGEVALGLLRLRDESLAADVATLTRAAEHGK